MHAVQQHGDVHLAAGEVAAQEVAEGVAVGQAQRPVGRRQCDRAQAGPAQSELGCRICNRIGIQHQAGDRLEAYVEVAEVRRGRAGDCQGVGRVAGAAVGVADGVGNQRDGHRAAGIGTEREVAESGGVGGLVQQNRGPGRIETDAVSIRRVDAEFGIEVVDGVEVDRLA